MKFDDKEDLQTVSLSLTDGNYLFDVTISLWKHWRKKKTLFLLSILCFSTSTFPFVCSPSVIGDDNVGPCCFA